jgi:hypothetical protein
MNICNDTLNIPETRHGINFDIYIYWVDASAGPRVSSAQWSVLQHWRGFLDIFITEIYIRWAHHSAFSDTSVFLSFLATSRSSYRIISIS